MRDAHSAAERSGRTARSRVGGSGGATGVPHDLTRARHRRGRDGPCVPLVAPHPFAHGVVRYAVLRADRDPARARARSASSCSYDGRVTLRRCGRLCAGSADVSQQRRVQYCCSLECRPVRAPRTHASTGAAGSATAVCGQRRSAVRTDDLQVLEPVVVCDAVDVVEDQRSCGRPRHSSPCRTARRPGLRARFVQPALQRAPAIGRAARPGPPRAASRRRRRWRPTCAYGRSGPCGILHTPRPSLEQRVVAARRAHAEPAQRLDQLVDAAIASRAAASRVARWHEHMFASGRTESAAEPSWGAGIRTPTSGTKTRRPAITPPPIGGARARRYYDATPCPPPPWSSSPRARGPGCAPRSPRSCTRSAGAP